MAQGICQSLFCQTSLSPDPQTVADWETMAEEADEETGLLDTKSRLHMIEKLVGGHDQRILSLEQGHGDTISLASTGGGLGHIPVRSVGPMGSAEVANPTTATPEDGGESLWDRSRKEQMKFFDQSHLMDVYSRPYRRAVNNGALMGGGFLGILALPFGPIGMAACFGLGAGCGALVGLCVDKRRAMSKIHQSEVEKNRLRSLVRWAAERLDDDNKEDQRINLEMVILEFKPIADIAQGSKNARKLLRLLDSWVAKKKAMRQLWTYMDQLLTNWRGMTQHDFFRAMAVLQTLIAMYQYRVRVLGEQERTFLLRIERLLNHEYVKLILAQNQGQNFSTQPGGEIMESMVYADAQDLIQRRSPHRIITPARQDLPGLEIDPNVMSDDEDIVPHSSPLSAQGVLMLPASGDNSPRTPKSPQKMMRTERRLKPPFFKSWDDFMEFDLTFKRKMPITQSDFSLLLEKESQGQNGWDVAIDRKELRVYKSAGSDTTGGCITMRAWATLPGVDKLVAFNMFHKLHNRMTWDRAFSDMQLDAEGIQGSDVLYSVLRFMTFTVRDYVQYRRTKVLEDGAIAIVMRSAVHSGYPEKAGWIRAESFISGYVFREGWEDGKKVLKMFLMTCTDVKGLIPKWVINIVAPRKPGEWMNDLKKACLDYQEANPTYRERMEAELKPFLEANPFDYEDVLVDESPVADKEEVNSPGHASL
ncbi:unnamed protein product [Polarella glacialis]|uniref:START domain-containing protein n=1 Tax=Polarella glacialis TaxID=89957 RepID=A0A813H2S2_POLGL|nr:unnamed protein product [Polarella glacialis]